MTCSSASTCACRSRLSCFKSGPIARHSAAAWSERGGERSVAAASAGRRGSTHRAPPVPAAAATAPSFSWSLTQWWTCPLPGQTPFPAGAGRREEGDTERRPLQQGAPGTAGSAPACAGRERSAGRRPGRGTRWRCGVRAPALGRAGEAATGVEAAPTHALAGFNAGHRRICLRCVAVQYSVQRVGDWLVLCAGRGPELLGHLLLATARLRGRLGRH